MYLHAVVPHRPLQDGLERLSDAAVLKNNRALEDILTAATEEAVSESIKGMGCTPRGWGAHQGGGMVCMLLLLLFLLDKFLEKAQNRNRVPRTTLSFESAAASAADEAEKVGGVVVWCGVVWWVVVWCGAVWCGVGGVVWCGVVGGGVVWFWLHVMCSNVVCRSLSGQLRWLEERRCMDHTEQLLR